MLPPCLIFSHKYVMFISSNSKNLFNNTNSSKNYKLLAHNHTHFISDHVANNRNPVSYIWYLWLVLQKSSKEQRKMIISAIEIFVNNGQKSHQSERRSFHWVLSSWLWEKCLESQWSSGDPQHQELKIQDRDQTVRPSQVQYT